MTDADAIELLARWIYELRVERVALEHRAKLRETELTQQIVELEQKVRGYGFWMRSGLTPDEIWIAGQELDPAVIGA